MEVIARKQFGVGLQGFICMILGLGLVGLGFWSIMSENIDKMEQVGLFFVCFLLGSAVSICGLIQLIIALISPGEIITYKDGKLSFKKTEFSPSQIKTVEYKPAFSRWHLARWGRIKVFLSDGQVLSNNCVAQIEQVHNRLIELMTEHISKEKQTEFQAERDNKR